MNLAILDLETSSKPLLHPWMSDAYLSTIGLRMHVDGKQYYREWVWYHSERGSITEQDRLQIVFELQEELDKLGPNDFLIGHNLKFDINWIKSLGVQTEHVTLWCTQVAEYMLRGQAKLPDKYNLSECCALWKLPVKTDVVKTYWDAGRPTHKIPLKVLLPYMQNDIDITAELFKCQYKKMRQKNDLFQLCLVRQRCLETVSDIELNGMPFDMALADKYVAKFKAELEVTDAELRTYFGCGDLNINSGVELSAGLFGGTITRDKYEPCVYTRNVTIKEPYKFTYKSGKMKGQTVTKYKNRVLRELTCKRVRTEYEVPIKGVGFSPDPGTEGKNRDGSPSGVFKTNKGVLKQLACNTKGGTSVQLKKLILNLLLHRSKINKFTETFEGAKKDTGLFYKRGLNCDGWLHPNYNQTIAATGRFTSSDPNGQNFPRSKEDEDGFTNPLKRVFVSSRPKGLILVVDLAQLEWRVAAWLSQDQVAITEILNGVDCHLDNAIKFFGDAKYRQAAKVFTFRMLYGGTPYAFYKDPLMPDFTLKRWTEISDEYQRKYIGLTNWQNKNISDVGMNNGWLFSPTGRLYRIPQEPHKKHPGVMTYSPKKIKNYPVQGTATADIKPLSMNMIRAKMTEDPHKYMSTNWFGQVHDSSLFDTNQYEVKHTARMCIEQFEALPAEIERIWGLKVNVPFTGEATAGVNYGQQTWSLVHEDGQWIEKGDLF